jgi:hypothetical protein
MISGFATMAEDVLVRLLEGNGRLLSVMVDVFIAGSIPDRLILRCGGSSWMLRLRFLVGDGVAKQCKSSEPATDEGVIAEELYMDLGDKSLAAETCKDLCDGETGMLQNEEMEEMGGGELAGQSTSVAGDVLSGGRETLEQGNPDMQPKSLKGKQVLQGKEDPECEGGSCTKIIKGRSPYSLRQRKSKAITLMDEEEVAKVMQVCSCQTLRREGFNEE